VRAVHRDHDALLQASTERIVDYSKPTTKEKGVKIVVGGPIIPDETANSLNTVVDLEPQGIEFEPFF